MRFSATRWILWMVLAVGFVTMMGCETPESQSSVPWNRPQPWERQGMSGIGY